MSSSQHNLRRSSSHKVEVIKLGQPIQILFFLGLNDGMDVDPQLIYTYIYKIGKHTYETLSFNFEVHMPLLEAVSVH